MKNLDVSSIHTHRLSNTKLRLTFAAAPRVILAGRFARVSQCLVFSVGQPY